MTIFRQTLFDVPHRFFSSMKTSSIAIFHLAKLDADLKKPKTFNYNMIFTFATKIFNSTQTNLQGCSGATSNDAVMISLVL